MINWTVRSLFFILLLIVVVHLVLQLNQSKELLNNLNVKVLVCLFNNLASKLTPQFAHFSITIINLLPFKIRRFQDVYLKMLNIFANTLAWLFYLFWWG